METAEMINSTIVQPGGDRDVEMPDWTDDERNGLEKRLLELRDRMDDVNRRITEGLNDSEELSLEIAIVKAALGQLTHAGGRVNKMHEDVKRQCEARGADDALPQRVLKLRTERSEEIQKTVRGVSLESRARLVSRAGAYVGYLTADAE